MLETQVRHPLEPLSEEEIAAAVAILREQKILPARHRFVQVTLDEPPKHIVLGYHDGDPIDRAASIVLLARPPGTGWGTVVTLPAPRAGRGRAPPAGPPPITLEEFDECERACKASPEYREALRKRGITDLDLVIVDPWSAGSYGEDEGRRLSRALSWVRLNPNDNAYAHPIENVIAVVDLDRMEVVRIEDYGVVPVPMQPGNYTPDAVGTLRTDLQPLDIHQPDGPSFTIDGHAIQWQKWHLRLGFTPREGLVLHTVAYEDQGRLRPILYRAALSEMVVPYGDPAPTHQRKNAFDAGEYNIGALANALELGCDCLGEIRYFDAVLVDSAGRPFTLRNAICLHEEDYGILWKHFDFRTGEAEVRRSRRLVISSISTVANYEYGFFWYLYQDGTIQFEVKLTGIVSTGAVPPGEKPAYGQLLNADGLYAPNHQHFFNVRLDLDIDGPVNQVYEVHTEAPPLGPENPYGNAFRSRATLLSHESEAQQLVDPLSGRYWKIVNPTVSNSLGEPVAYKLMPGENVRAFALPESSIAKRAAFMTKHLWVTPYAPDEIHAAGAYPNQHPGGAGLPTWTAADRLIADTDVVLWYTFGAHHIVRPEDWPVMPVNYIGFMLKPIGFFDCNPALDVPPPAGHDGHCHV